MTVDSGGNTYTTRYDSNGCAFFIDVPASSSGTVYAVSSSADVWSPSVLVCAGMATDVEYTPNHVLYQPGPGCLS